MDRLNLRTFGMKRKAAYINRQTALSVLSTTRRRTSFQSSSDPKVGRYPSWPSDSATMALFQSSSDPKVGRYHSAVNAPAVVFLFQSSSDPKVGRYFLTPKTEPWQKAFQSSSDR